MRGIALAKVLAAWVAVVAVLGVVRFKPWVRVTQSASRPLLKVGFLPVT